MGDGGVDGARLWRVSLTVSGVAMEPRIVKGALKRLSEERPFLDAVRYGADCAQITYWDEAESVVDAGSLALRMWAEHRNSANLPSWEVVALEVTERTAHQHLPHLDAFTDLTVVPSPL
jgi:hypothetical protein